MLVWIMGFSVAASIGAVLGAAVILLFPATTRKTLIPSLISYAAGALMAAAFLGMIPSAVEQSSVRPVMATVLGGVVLFFVLEKIVLWRHCHDEHCEVHSRAASLILIGDAFHNFVDGLVIASAFLVSVPLGIATSLAVIAHEVPQEVGDFAILLDSGYSRTKALVLNTLSASTTLPGALLGYFWLDQLREFIPMILGLSAASFIYIAIADLIPELHRQVSPAVSFRQFVLLLAGIGTIVAMQTVL